MKPEKENQTVERTPEKREDPGHWSRRRFIGSAAAATAFTIVPRHVLGGVGYTPPSDTVTIGIIGTGGQGIVNMKSLLQEPDVKIVAIADPNLESDYSAFYYGGTAGRGPALKLLNDVYKEKQANYKCNEYMEHRQLLDKEKNIDAVLIATPDHSHAVIVMAALKLGKHVYCEKPLCRTVWETRKIVEAAKEAKVATQMGNQGHSGEGIRLTCEWIWDGAIGDVREVHSWADVQPWTYARERPKDTPPVPPDFDWDIWLGPAPERPYHPAYTPVMWRSWFDFGTGHMGDFACHHLDPAFWALKLGYPSMVEASWYGGGPELFPFAALIRMNFPARGKMSPVKVTWYDGGLMPPTPEDLEPDRKINQSGHGILFIGDKGKILAGGWGGSPRLIPESAMRAYKRPERTIKRVPGHHRDWLNACKGGEPSSANFEAVGPMVEAVLMGVIALRLKGERLIWDGKSLKCTNVPAANDFVRPEYRKGWEL
jgi:predicted dehydrogenase